MIFIRQPAMLKRHRLALRQERDLDCVLAGSIYRGRASGLCFLIGHNFLEDNVPMLPVLSELETLKVTSLKLTSFKICPCYRVRSVWPFAYVSVVHRLTFENRADCGIHH